MLLTVATRGAEETPPTIRLTSEERFVLLAVEPPVLEPADRTLGFTVTVMSQEGTSVWDDGALTAERVESLSSSSGVLTLLIPQSDLPDGSYYLRFSRREDTPDGLVFEYPFVVERATP